jgi:hypothetical protein
MNKAMIIERIGAKVYWHESQEAQRKAPYTSGRDRSLIYDSDTPYHISNLVWRNDETPLMEKVRLILEIYHDLPAYSFLAIIYRDEYRAFPGEVRQFYFAELTRIALEQESLAEPILYTLALDFFDDLTEAAMAWTITSQRRDHPKWIQNLLEISGPVPFRLKYDLYHQLLPNETFHAAIFTSLYQSCFAPAGDIDKGEAANVLNQLHVPRDTDTYRALYAALHEDH